MFLPSRLAEEGDGTSRSWRYLEATAAESALSMPVSEVLPLARIASRQIIDTAAFAAGVLCPRTLVSSLKASCG